ncbi:hypothetical protein B0T18DRAFT_179030 [Schizothecium vesticola]|uniref:Uncharacterized protein n=1 Tax=Schizothecium vesticola TaxID=314040 RepID=A0AA40K2H1_9PEZI|nr:hypothetical protein B0T18DRAFT_179030 [Schizothecium vesticola]
MPFLLFVCAAGLPSRLDYLRPCWVLLESIVIGADRQVGLVDMFCTLTRTGETGHHFGNYKGVEIKAQPHYLSKPFLSSQPVDPVIPKSVCSPSLCIDHPPPIHQPRHQPGPMTPT